MYHEAHCKFKNVFSMQAHPNVQKPPTFTGRRFLMECTSNTKICAYYPILRKKVQGQTLLCLNVLQQPACIRRQAEQPLKNVKLNPLQR